MGNAVAVEFNNEAIQPFVRFNHLWSPYESLIVETVSGDPRNDLKNPTIPMVGLVASADGQKLSRTFETAFGIARGQIACGAQYALHCSRLTYCDAGQELSKLVLVLDRPSGARPTIFLPYWG